MAQHSVLFIGCDSATAAGVEAALPGTLAGTLLSKSVETLFEGLLALQGQTFDVVVSDVFSQGGHGQVLSLLRYLQQNAPLTALVALCHSNDRETGSAAVRHGAHDYLCYEDVDSGELRSVIERVMQRQPVKTEKKPAGERRHKERFPCRLSLHYQTLELPDLSSKGHSESLNISSSGLLFSSDEVFHMGQLIQVSVDWPARLDKEIPLKLVVQGRVVRNGKGETAMTIESYEYRTRRMPSVARSFEVLRGGNRLEALSQRAR